MSIEALRALADRLGQSSRALAVLGLAVQARATGRPLDATLQARIDEVLAALGAHDTGVHLC
jgi:hypothetical protein